jgi:hypothetical protein
MAARELAPGEAKNDVLLLVVTDDVRNPVVVKVETSRGVKAVPGIVVDVGLASIRDMYLAGMVSLVDISFSSNGLTLEVFRQRMVGLDELLPFQD